MLRAAASRLIPFHSMAREMEKELIMDHSQANGLILDAGCGDKSFGVTCFGYSAVYLDIEKTGDIQSDLVMMPFKDETFNYVLVNSVLEHIEYLDKALSEISRVSKKGSQIVATIPSDYGSKLSPLTRALWNQKNNFSPEIWSQLFEKHGMKVELLKKYFSKELHIAYILACVFYPSIFLSPLMKFFKNKGDGMHIFLRCVKL